MMLKEVAAVYENGVLRPLEPLPLTEQERVLVSVSRGTEGDWLDTEFMDACAADADPSVTLQQVRSSMAKIRGSMDAAIDEDRGDY
jgi:predicted DNA-binding antitoxin AbrB/MazE fold protein